MSGILGLDPGITGALALYRDGQWILLDMPVAGDAKHHEIDGPAYALGCANTRPIMRSSNSRRHGPARV
jgi:hypothetical protein